MINKRTLTVIIVTLLTTIVGALGVSSPVWVSPVLWDQDALKYPPIGPGYPVLAITQVIDGDTFEALVHIAPKLLIAVHVRVGGVDTPEITGDCREEGKRVRDLVAQFLASAGEIRVELTGYSFGRWVCIVTVNGEDLAEWIKANKLTKVDLCPMYEV